MAPQGVHMAKISNFRDVPGAEVAYRKLNPGISKQQKEMLEKFRREVVGNKYGLSTKKLF